MRATLSCDQLFKQLLSFFVLSFNGSGDCSPWWNAIGWFHSINLIRKTFAVNNTHGQYICLNQLADTCSNFICPLWVTAPSCKDRGDGRLRGGGWTAVNQDRIYVAQVMHHWSRCVIFLHGFTVFTLGMGISWHLTIRLQNDHRCKKKTFCTFPCVIFKNIYTVHVSLLITFYFCDDH